MRRHRHPGRAQHARQVVGGGLTLDGGVGGEDHLAHARRRAPGRASWRHRQLVGADAVQRVEGAAAARGRGRGTPRSPRWPRRSGGPRPRTPPRGRGPGRGTPGRGRPRASRKHVAQCCTASAARGQRRPPGGGAPAGCRSRCWTRRVAVRGPTPGSCSSSSRSSRTDGGRRSIRTGPGKPGGRPSSRRISASAPRAGGRPPPRRRGRGRRPGRRRRRPGPAGRSDAVQVLEPVKADLDQAAAGRALDLELGRGPSASRPGRAAPAA